MNFYEFYEQYFPFWNKLNDTDKDFLCQNSAIEYFEKEQVVHNNMECSGLYIVKNGKLRLYMLSEDGKEITLYRLGTGDICMLSASCVLQSITFEVYVDAELPSECYRINGTAREVVTRMLKHFASDGIIEVTRKGIIISDRKKLRDVAI